MPVSAVDTIEIVVPSEVPPSRLDQFLATHLPPASRRRLRRLGVPLIVNGRTAKRSSTVYPGDRIRVPRELIGAPRLEASPDLHIPVIHQDDAIVVVDKPAGVDSVALRPEDTHTVASFLVTAFPDMRSIGPSPLEAGLAHRLDRDTSGLLIAARTRDVYADLRRQFSTREVRKEYLALVVGDLSAPGVVEAPIAHDARHPKRMRVCADAHSGAQLGARQASTEYRPEVRYGFATLVRLTMHTGVRHQIRAHLAWLGHPVVGDRIYGRGVPCAVPMRRHALHACRIDFVHPLSGKPMAVYSPLPPDIEVALRWCAARQRR